MTRVPEVLDRPAHGDRLQSGPIRELFDELAARRTLLDQVARLEGELGSVFCATWPRTQMPHPTVATRGGGSRLLSLAELEELRDELAGRISDARRALSDRTWVEDRNRCLIEEMMLA